MVYHRAYIKDTYNSTTKRQAAQFKNDQRTWTDISLKKDIQMANNCMKICSTLLVTREKQIKTTLRYHFTDTRIAIIIMIFKRWKITSIGEDVAKLKPFYYTVNKNVKWCSHCGNILAVPQKVKYRIIMRCSHSTPKYIPLKIKTGTQINACTWLFKEALFTIIKRLKQWNVHQGMTGWRNYVIYTQCNIIQSLKKGMICWYMLYLA